MVTESLTRKFHRLLMKMENYKCKASKLIGMLNRTIS